MVKLRLEMTSASFVIMVESMRLEDRSWKSLWAQPASRAPVPSFFPFLLPSLSFLFSFLGHEEMGLGEVRSRREWQEKRQELGRGRKYQLREYIPLLFFPAVFFPPTSLDLGKYSWGHRDLCVPAAAWLLFLAWLYIRLALSHDGIGPAPCGTAGKYQKPNFSFFQLKLIFTHILCCDILLTSSFSNWDVHFFFLKKGLIFDGSHTTITLLDERKS